MVREIVVLVLALSACTNSFEPVTRYEQTRTSESSGSFPRPRHDEDPNAHRLKESLAVTKVHQVYEEEGYEDGAYDHGLQEEHGRSREAYFRPKLHDYSPQSSLKTKQIRTRDVTDEDYAQDEEAEHRKSYRADYDEEYNDDDNENSTKDEYDDDDDDDDDDESETDADYEHITVPQTWKEDKPKESRSNDDKWTDKEIEDFKTNFEKEWKTLKVGPELEKSLGNMKEKPLVGGSDKEMKKKKNKSSKKNKLATKMKMKDKYNAFKYKPIKVPRTKIKGLGPFRPLVIGGHVIYPGMIAKTRNPYAIMGMPSVVSVSAYPHRWVPSSAHSQFHNEFNIATNNAPSFARPSTAKRSPALVKISDPTLRISPVSVGYPSPVHSNDELFSIIRSPPKRFAATPDKPSNIHFMGGFTPMFPPNVPTQQNRPSQRQKLNSESNTNLNEESDINRPNNRKSVKSDLHSKSQNLTRGHVKYIERLTASHFSTPKRKELFKPISKTKQKRIKDLAKQLNSEHSTKNKSQKDSQNKRRIGRTNKSHIMKVSANDNKYPFYQTDSDVISEDSPLNYIRNPKLIPHKTLNNMVLYPENDPNPCDDPKFPDGILPKHKADGEWIGERNVNRPRAVGVGASIQCYKNKYFGQEPLDNPLFLEIKKKSRKNANRETEQSINSGHRFNSNGRKKRDVDLNRYHVVLTRQSRRPTYDYEDDDDDDAKTEETTHAETSTAASTERVRENKQETTTMKLMVSSEPEVNSRPSVDRRKEVKRSDEGKDSRLESDEESLEKLIPVITKPIRRMHRPRHAYSSRYLMSTTKRIYTTAEPPPTTTADNKNDEKKMALKQRIKFLTSRPIKFSLLPGNSQESVEKVRIPTTTTEEPTTTTESLPSSTKRMYPAKRKLLKLRKGPFNIFSVLNDGKSATTKFPLMEYYNEAKMSSSETVEMYEEHIEPSEVTTEKHHIIEPPRKIKIRRPQSLMLRESNVKSVHNDHNHAPLVESSRPNRSSTKERKKYGNSNKKERAVEVEFHQVLVQKIDPIDELNDAMPPMMESANSTSSSLPPVRTTKVTNFPKTSIKAASTRSPDDALVYSINAATGTGTWKKFKDKADKVKKDTSEISPPSSAEEKESSFNYRRTHQQERQLGLQQRRRKPTNKPTEKPIVTRDITGKQAFVVGLMTQVMPKDINEMGQEVSSVPSIVEDIVVKDDGRVFEITPVRSLNDDYNESNDDRHRTVEVDDETEGPTKTLAVEVPTTTTAEPRWRKSETNKIIDSQRRRKPTVVTEERHRRKFVRTQNYEEPKWNKSPTEEPEFQEPKITRKQPQWRRPTTTTTVEPEESEVEATEVPRWKLTENNDKPVWEPSEITEEPRWTPPATTEKKLKRKPERNSQEPRWKPAQNDESSPWKPLSSIQFKLPENVRDHQSKLKVEEEVEIITVPPEGDSELTFNFDFDVPVQNENPIIPEPEPVQVFDPHLVTLYTNKKKHRFNENVKPIQVDDDLETEVQTLSYPQESEDQVSEAPKVKKPPHIIRKLKPKSDSNEPAEGIKSPALRVETLEKRRRLQFKNKANDEDSESLEKYGSTTEEQKDQHIDAMIKRRKQFLQNLLRPSIIRHKSNEQPDSNTAESAPKWIKDPRQRSYFYVND